MTYWLKASGMHLVHKPLCYPRAAQQVIGNLFKGLSKQKYGDHCRRKNLSGKQQKKCRYKNTKWPAVPGINRRHWEKPKPTETVLVNYRGTLLNGKQFDSSYERNEPPYLIGTMLYLAGQKVYS